MTVDWLTVGAQVLNFLVLVYLLKRLLYGPIERAMARREAAIAERLRDAEQQKQDATGEAQRYREAREALEEQRERLLARAREEADELRETLAKELREETDRTRERWRVELDREQAAFLHDVRRHAAEQFETLARRALADLASAELEAEMARVLLGRLRELEEDRREALARAGAPGEPLRVRSAFELPTPVKRSVASALHDTLGREREIVYERAAEVVCGVEIRVGGVSLGWSLQSYLDELAGRLAHVAAPASAGTRQEPR